MKVKIGLVICNRLDKMQPNAPVCNRRCAVETGALLGLTVSKSYGKPMFEPVL